MLISIAMAVFGAMVMAEHVHDERHRFAADPYPVMWRGLLHAALVSVLFLVLLEYGPSLVLQPILSAMFGDGLFGTPDPPRHY